MRVEIADGAMADIGDKVWIWRRGKWVEAEITGYTLRLRYAGGETGEGASSVFAHDTVESTLAPLLQPVSPRV